MTNALADLLAENRVLLADGAMGTNLFALGLSSGEAPELWNVLFPERIEGLHRDFIEAGADIILTNSFGGTHYRLKLHQAQDRVHELNKLAAELGCAAANKAKRPVIVAGSVGPTGELLVPLGTMTLEDARDAFVEQMQGLKDGGAQVLWIETMSAPGEIQAAAEAAAIVGLPYVYTASFDTAGRTMMGLAPAEIFSTGDGAPAQPVAVGANCGVGAPDNLVAILEMSAARPDATLIVKGNCGMPEFRGTEVHYSGTPEIMADYTRLALDLGARIIGGCCGTACEHLSAMRLAIDTYEPSERPDVAEIERRVGILRNKRSDQSGANAVGTGRRERRRQSSE